MLTIGKTLEGNINYLNMKRSSVLNGKQRISSKLMQMDARMNIDANIHTAGKNKNIILLTIRCMLADNKIPVISLTVHIIILRLIEDNQLVHAISCFLRIEGSDQISLHKVIKTSF